LEINYPEIKLSKLTISSSDNKYDQKVHALLSTLNPNIEPEKAIKEE